MKLAAHNIAGFLRSPQKQSRATLLYGPDNGLVRERSKLISTMITGKNADPFCRVELTGERIKSDPAIVMDELCSISLLGGEKVIIITEPNEKMEPILKSAFESVKNTNYLVIEADDLSASSSLRKLFEYNDMLVALPCYLPDARDLQGYIREYSASIGLPSIGLQVNQDALLYLSENLGNDRMVTKNELDKIALYLGEQRQVTLEVAMLLTGGNANDTVEDLCHAIALGKMQEADTLIHRLLAEGTQAIAIIRALIRYFQRLDLALGYTARGESKDNAIKMLRPPVFFKSVEVMKQAMTRLTPKKTAHQLTLLLKAEKEAKSGVISADTITKQLILALV